MSDSLFNQLTAMQRFFESGTTKSYKFRTEQLRRFRSLIKQHENDLHEALYQDLKKSPEESWVTETGFLLNEINYAIRNLKRWMSPEKVGTNLVNFPSSSFILREPLGVVLIIGPWNYPLQLLLNPLVGAMGAGNCAVLKASEFAPATSKVMKQIIDNNFSKEYILLVEGDGAQIVTAMMNQFRFNHVFFTGSAEIGKRVYKMAAEQLTPVTLELGGKSPCVVEDDANVKVAAKRIATTKFSNAGQMCVAPDYLLVHEKIKEEFIASMKTALRDFFSEQPISDYGYCKIVNEKQFDRLSKYLREGKVISGGKTDRSQLFIEPTLIEDVPLASLLMNEEIFGPILPIVSFRNFEEAKFIIDKNPNPLAFYVYSSSTKKQNQWLAAVPAGGACINNSSWQLTNHHLPFGGIGNSGIGEYHGRYSFETFSHRKSVLKTPTWFDPSIKYPPFKGKLSLFKKVIG
jgi:aldehyde dehydrogenase (NAD+)